MFALNTMKESIVLHIVSSFDFSFFDKGTWTSYLFCLVVQPSRFAVFLYKMCLIRAKIVEHKSIEKVDLREKIKITMGRYFTATALLQVGILLLSLSCTTEGLSLEDQVQQLTENYVIPRRIDDFKVIV